MRKLLATAALLIAAFILPGFVGTLFGIAGGFVGAAYLFSAPRAQRLLKWSAEKYVADDSRRDKVKDWINTDSN
ncbi:MAG: hypothetical protein ACI9W4_002777 [Rhodothermales bacterium]|jgi:hypothetical protein